MYTLDRTTFTTRNMVKISILAVISMVLFLFDISTWFAPPFLKIDLSDLPALIGSFSMGPMAGVLVQLVKNLLNLMLEGSMTGGVGELSNFLVGSVFVYTAGAVYHRNKTFKNAIIGLFFGIIVMTIFASVSNYFVVFPLYAKLMPMDQIIEMSAAVNKLVVDYKSMILYAVVPFNLLKGTIVSSITLLVYKKLSPILKK
ncbi:MAG: ECF transporter S component [Tissierellaceae bacterium]|nr:ECF transporter S component [Tissierellaceae bacterium]